MSFRKPCLRPGFDARRRALRVGVTCCLSGLIALGLSPSVVRAQSFGIAPHVGTLGVGGDVGVLLTNRIGLRAGRNYFPFDIDFSASDVDFTLDLPSPQSMVLADLFLVGGLRASGGVLLSGDDVGLTGDFGGSVDLGGTTYTAAEVGTLRGAIVNKDVAPYAGIGYGKVAGQRLGFLLDLGIAFQGNPRVSFAADGLASLLPSFQADLERERQEVENDIHIFRYYPVFSLGLTIGFL